MNLLAFPFIARQVQKNEEMVTWKCKFQCRGKFHLLFKICRFYYGLAMWFNSRILNIEIKITWNNGSCVKCFLYADWIYVRVNSIVRWFVFPAFWRWYQNTYFACQGGIRPQRQALDRETGFWYKVVKAGMDSQSFVWKTKIHLCSIKFHRWLEVWNLKFQFWKMKKL